MTEYEKMIAGEFYNATDVELVAMRAKARDLLTRVNASLQDITTGERLKLCRELFGRVGEGLWLQPPFYCDYGKNIELGDKVYFNFNCVVLDVAKVTIGSNVLFGPNVQIYTAGHPLDAAERRKGLEFGKPVTIADDVWVGGGAILCPGITVGAGSVIGAGAIVTKDVAPGVVAAGNPAREIRTV